MSMNYDEYVREGIFQYEAFARTVATLLQAAIDDSGEDFHLQQITSRPKSKTSLHRKLSERGLFESQTIETDLKDLAGRQARTRASLLPNGVTSCDKPQTTLGLFPRFQFG